MIVESGTDGWRAESGSSFGKNLRAVLSRHRWVETDSVARQDQSQKGIPQFSKRTGPVMTRRSVPEGGAVAARVGPALQPARLRIDPDRLRMSHVIVPVVEGLCRLTSCSELADYLVGDASL